MGAKEGSVFQLPIEQVATSSLRERAIAFLGVADLANDGGAALCRVWSGETVDDEIRRLLEEGEEFLEQVLLDIEHCRNGVKFTQAQKGPLRRFNYHPGEIFFFAAEAGHQELDLQIKERAEQVMRAMEQTAQELSPVFRCLIEGNPLDLEKLWEYLEKYSKLAAPYRNVALIASGQARRGEVPRHLSQIYNVVVEV